jgi:hypothetical protein
LKAAVYHPGYPDKKRLEVNGFLPETGSQAVLLFKMEKIQAKSNPAFLHTSGNAHEPGAKGEKNICFLRF